jgi:hypothetical protein
MTTATRKPPTPSRSGSAPSTAASNGRDVAGKFTAGNTAGRGNPHCRRVAQLRTAALNAVSPEEMRDLVKHLYGLAMAGDTAAARLVMEYVMGKPAPAADPDAVDLHELAIALGGVDVADFATARGRIAPGLAATRLLRGQVQTAEGLIAALQAHMLERYEEMRRLATAGQLDDLHELERLGREAGVALGEDEDADEDDDD